MDEPGTITREQFLSLTPDVYLGDGLADSKGDIRPQLLGEYATAAVEQLLAGHLRLDELEATYQALVQTLPLHQGQTPERFLAAYNEALEIASMMMGGRENNEALLKWLHSCAPSVETEKDLEAFMAHFLAVFRQYAAIQAIRDTQ